jgi:hypothetical protein
MISKDRTRKLKKRLQEAQKDTFKALIVFQGVPTAGDVTYQYDDVSIVNPTQEELAHINRLFEGAREINLIPTPATEELNTIM